MFEVESAAPSILDTPVDFGVDPTLLRAVVVGTKLGLQMTHRVATPIGTSRLTTARHAVTVMVGLVGQHSGNIALNLSEAATMHLVSGLMGSPVTELNDDCIDAVMELGNMVAGGIKTALANTGFSMSNISLPSLVIGQGYNMAYARGIQAVCVEFELSNMQFSQMNARYLSSTLSLLRGAGV